MSVGLNKVMAYELQSDEHEEGIKETFGLLVRCFGFYTLLSHHQEMFLEFTFQSLAMRLYILLRSRLVGGHFFI